MEIVKPLNSKKSRNSKKSWWQKQVYYCEIPLYINQGGMSFKEIQYIYLPFFKYWSAELPSQLKQSRPGVPWIWELNCHFQNYKVNVFRKNDSKFTGNLILPSLTLSSLIWVLNCKSNTKGQQIECSGNTTKWVPTKMSRW